jgi:uncharacterized protein (TIGR02246 family)
MQQETLSTRVPDELRPGLLALVGRINAALSRNDSKAFAAEFAEDASLINPGGEYARGRADVEALIKKDLDGILRDSKSSMELIGARQLSPTLAGADLTHHIDRAHYPDGKVGPLDVHVACVCRRSGSNWELLDARPYVFLKPPVLH